MASYVLEDRTRHFHLYEYMNLILLVILFRSFKNYEKFNKNIFYDFRRSRTFVDDVFLSDRYFHLVEMISVTEILEIFAPSIVKPEDRSRMNP